MIILLVSATEARDLMARKPDQGLRAYIGRELSLERLLPDDNLPDVVELRKLELDDSGRHYIAVMRTYATAEAADRAWNRKETA